MRIPLSWLSASMLSAWTLAVIGALSDEQAAKLREYLERGGFLFCDSFFGEGSWASYKESLSRVFPDRSIVDLKDEEVVSNG